MLDGHQEEAELFKGWVCSEGKGNIMRGFGDPLSVDDQYFFSVRANSPCTHCTQMPCSSECQCPAHKEGTHVWQGKFMTGLAACGCAMCWTGAEGCLAPSVGLPHVPVKWKLYWTTGFTWEPNLLESGAVKVNLCYLGQTETSGYPMDRWTIAYKPGRGQSTEHYCMCPHHTQPQPTCPVKYQQKIASFQSSWHL